MNCSPASGRRFAFVCVEDDSGTPILAMVIEGDERAKRRQMPTWFTVTGDYALSLSHACNFDVLGYNVEEVNQIMMSVGYGRKVKPSRKAARGMH